MSNEVAAFHVTWDSQRLKILHLWSLDRSGNDYFSAELATGRPTTRMLPSRSAETSKVLELCTTFCGRTVQARVLDFKKL